jgi:hypothetical protein
MIAVLRRARRSLMVDTTAVDIGAAVSIAVISRIRTIVKMLRASFFIGLQGTLCSFLGLVLRHHRV